jgi:hypothetical protein
MYRANAAQNAMKSRPLPGVAAHSIYRVKHNATNQAKISPHRRLTFRRRSSRLSLSDDMQRQVAISNVLLSRGSVVAVRAIVFALDFLEEFLRFLRLSVPLSLTHLGLAIEKLIIWLAIAAAQAIP